MPSFELLAPFFVASAIFACVPGPGMFYAAAQTIAQGRRAGWLSALGFHLGGFLHISAAAFGLAILLKTVPVFYVIVKLAGATYLIWLGIKYFRAGGRFVMIDVAVPSKPSRKALRDSIVVEVLNPKTALFYLAFLPQFADDHAALPVWTQILVLGAIVNVMFSITDAVCIVLSEAVTKRLAASQRISRLAQRIGGGILIALGVNLAVSRQ
ncbi:MAG: LysE family translocator [Rhodospirillales bacterium]|nr:LysE family translocator [Rhodospirillales bacterium]